MIKRRKEECRRNTTNKTLLPDNCFDFLRLYSNLWFGGIIVQKGGPRLSHYFVVKWSDLIQAWQFEDSRGRPCAVLVRDRCHIYNLLYTNRHTQSYNGLKSCCRCGVGAWMWLLTVNGAFVTHRDTQRKLSRFNMLFACWFIQWENISEMSSFSWACMIHSGLFHLWMSPWVTVQISSAGQAAPMLQY